MGRDHGEHRMTQSHLESGKSTEPKCRLCKVAPMLCEALKSLMTPCYRNHCLSLYVVKELMPLLV